MAKGGKNQKGAVNKAEGTHGDKTHAAFLEQINSGSERNEPAPREAGEARPPREGKHHIYEDRQQHDEADKNSDKNRLNHDIDLDRVPGDEK